MKSNIHVVEKIGKNPGMNVVVMAGVHGDEACGVRAFEKLISEMNIDNGKVTFIVANLEALRQNKRYVEYNLNRCFLNEQPLGISDSLEGSTAREIMPFLLNADALLDLHSSDSSDSLDYIICEGNCFDFISSFGSEKVLTGIDRFQPGSSDGFMYNLGKPGVCVECGLNDSLDSVKIAKDSILNFLAATGNINYLTNRNVPKKIYHSNFLYRNTNEKFKLSRKFRDFEKMDKKTLIGYDGDKEVFLEKNDVIIFPNEAKEIGSECFLAIREERLLNLEEDKNK